MTKTEMAKYLRLSPNSFTRALYHGCYQDMPHKGVGKWGDFVFDKDEVMRYLERKFN